MNELILAKIIRNEIKDAIQVPRKYLGKDKIKNPQLPMIIPCKDCLVRSICTETCDQFKVYMLWKWKQQLMVSINEKEEYKQK